MVCAPPSLLTVPLLALLTCSFTNADAAHAGSTLVSDRMRLVRSEQRFAESQVHLGMPGELGSVADKLSDPEIGVVERVAASWHSAGRTAEHHRIADYEHQLMAAKADASEKICGTQGEGCNDLCKIDYPLGVPDTNDCVDINNHTVVLDEAMCREAARLSNASAGGGETSPFLVAEEYSDYFPFGCFKIHGKPEYYFNPAGGYPKWPMGIPICYKDKFKNGTTGANDGCPRGFQKILDDLTCRETALCLGLCINEDNYEYGVNVSAPAEDTRQADAWKYDNFPRGCFIKPDDGCVYYNVPRDYTPAGPISGTPLCNVTTVVAMDAATSPL